MVCKGMRSDTEEGVAKGCNARTSVKKGICRQIVSYIYTYRQCALKRLLVAGSNKNGGWPDKNGCYRDISLRNQKDSG